jgi:signal transduction histidine kinase
VRGTLRIRLLCYTSAATALVLVAAGLAVFYLTRSSLLSEFDVALLSAARAIQSATEQNAGGIRVDADSTQFPEYARMELPDYFEVWTDDGGEVARSASMVDKGTFLRPVHHSSEAIYSFVTLPDGQPGRELAVRFVPTGDDEEKRTHANGPAHAATLVVARHTAALEARLGSLKWLLIFVGLTATAVTAATLHVAVARGLRPLGVLGSRISQIRQGNLLERIELPHTPAELKLVVDRLNELLARLHEAITRERAFTADVAHELRTPLAGLEVTLEVSALKQRASADYEARINKSLSIVRDMRWMVENLLTLARADAGQLAVNRSEIEIGSLIEDCWSQFALRAEARGLKTSLRIEAMSLVSDRDQLRIVLHNLMDNAVSYCTPGGEIAITARQDHGSVEISTCNGAAIDPGQVSRVFDRFWRADAARTEAAAHCGLGLSLCRKIVQLLGGSISVQAPDPNTFQVLLRLPAAISPTSAALANSAGD